MRGGVFEDTPVGFWFAIVPFCVLLLIAALLDYITIGVVSVLRHAREVMR